MAKRLRPLFGSNTFVCILALIPSIAAAQGIPNGTISGYVTDPDNRVVPGARVVVTVNADGFKTLHQNGLVIEAEQQARLDFKLTVGSRTESITVEGSAPLLNTSEPVIDAEGFWPREAFTARLKFSPDTKRIFLRGPEQRAMSRGVPRQRDVCIMCNGVPALADWVDVWRGGPPRL